MAARFDLVLLDLDGTLVDSESILVRLVAETVIAAGFPSPDATAVARLIGLPLEEVFQRSLPTAPGDAVASLCGAYRRFANAPEFVRQFRLYADTAETLATLRAAGPKLVIATSKGRATTLDILRHCEIAASIDDVFGGDMVSRGKPDREMVDRARERFSIAADRTVIVGDTSFDISMGKAAGVATCAAMYGMHSADSLRALEPDFTIDRITDLRRVVLAD